MSKTEQNAAFLQDRQHQYKKAALTAKRNGDLELAKKYIRMAKVFRLHLLNRHCYFVCIYLN